MKRQRLLILVLASLASIAVIAHSDVDESWTPRASHRVTAGGNTPIHASAGSAVNSDLT